MIPFRRFAVPVALALAATSALAQSPFMRLQKPSATAEVLQTKARRYTSKAGGPTIWLVGVAHVGQVDYYQSLQKLLDQQSSVFYEGVSKGGVDLASEQKKMKADPQLRSTYQLISDALGLQFQLNGIDYDRATFHNSDLSWEELTALEAKHPAEQGKMSLSSIGSILDPSTPQGKAIANYFASMKSDPSSIEAFRIGMAELLSTPDATKVALSANLNELLIKARNAKVLADVKSALSKTPADKSIAIFFGAGHMADMESHLVADLGYTPGEERWFSAVEGDSKKVTSQNGQMILGMMRAQMKALQEKKG